MKIKKGRNTVTSKIAYIAGFFDGEGCIRIKKANQGGNSYYLWVAITNSNKGILDMVRDLFGGQVRLAETSKNKDIYHLLITSSEACDMLKILSCFLIEKKEQALLGIKFHETKENLSTKEKVFMYNKMRKLKTIGNIYENPELLE